MYYDNGQKKNVYCGLASKPESKRKALELEISSLKEQKKGLSEKVSDLENKLRIT